MRTGLVFALLALSFALASPATFACDPHTGERLQMANLRWGGEGVAAWEPKPGTTETIKLPNDFALGVEIEPATAEKYAENLDVWPYPAELVKITLSDMTAPQKPRRLTTTWGGANSIQGYGARGGADRVDELGNL